MKVVLRIFCLSLLLGCTQSQKRNNESLYIHKDSSDKYRYSIIEDSENDLAVKSQLFASAKRIMTVLNISIRKNLYKDEPLLFIIDYSLSSFNAKFSANWGLDSGAIALSLRWTKSPKIRVSNILKNVLLKKTDTASMVYLKAKAIVLHELVHYLQTTPAVRNASSTHLRDHEMITKNLREYEAYSVSSFYFLENYDKKKLKEIMNSIGSMQMKCYLIMDSVADILYPIKDKST
jgi:hypothetical protein